MKCNLLILTCKTQNEIEALARDWFGFHKHLIIAFYGDAPEEAKLVPEAHFVQTDNMSAEGIEKILKIIRLYKYTRDTQK